MSSLSGFCTIQLNNGHTAIVDSSDYDYVARFKWHVHPGRYCWYAVRSTCVGGQKIQVRMHREIMTSHGICIKGFHIDHADRDGLNNRFSNLRIVGFSENNINQRIRKDNSSGFKGVYLHTPRYGSPGWRARLQVGKKRLHLGVFRTPEEAALAYNDAALRYYGEFALLNEI